MLKCRKRINQLRNNTILVMLQFFFVCRQTRDGLEAVFFGSGQEAI